MGTTISSFFQNQESHHNIVFLGLPGAGKTHMMYRSQISDDKPVKIINSTKGFNQENYLAKREFSCWDIGGCLIYGGEMPDEFFGTGSFFGLDVILNNL
jgi:GTPase SAR1 family protein